jgi:hypothetical protein
VYAGAVKKGKWILADKILRMTLSDRAIIDGIACPITICAVNWYYRRKEREDRPDGNDAWPWFLAIGGLCHQRLNRHYQRSSNLPGCLPWRAGNALPQCRLPARIPSV